jgi:3-hydroxyisobutyrate dehydrogenase-like beta-hydroxyacid dehydrogenase
MADSGSLPPLVGVIGLGAMGGAVARHLSELHVPAIVYDLDQAAVDRAVSAGCTAARSAAEAAQAGVVITSLPSDAPLLAVMSDPGVIKGLAGGVLIDLSTVHPDTVKAIAASTADSGIRVIDAPVSGGPSDAAAGTLVLFVGAEEADLAAVRPLLDLLGRVVHVGGVGTGKAMKLVNNTMSIGNLALSAEALGLGSRMGLDERRMFEIISTTGGRSFMFQKHLPNVLNDDFTPGFMLSLSAKDIRLSLAAAASADFEMPIASGVSRALEEGVEQGLGAENFSAVVKVFRPDVAGERKDS